MRIQAPIRKRTIRRTFREQENEQLFRSTTD